MIGAVMSGPIADFVERKGVLRTSVTFCAAGWFSIYFAKVPVFIAEIAPKNLRGQLTTLNQLMICTGVSVSFIIGTMLKWQTLALTALIPCDILVVGLFFIPESPRWLVWSLVRRFDQPQKYKPFISRCVVHGDLGIGSVKEVNVKSGLPATISTERLELLDDEAHILRIRIVGGDHRLMERRHGDHE